MLRHLSIFGPEQCLAGSRREDALPLCIPLTTIHASEVAASEVGHCDQAPESMEEAVNTTVRRKSGSRGLGRCGLGNPRLPLAEWPMPE